MDRITDCLRINGVELRINVGADELQVGEVIICYPQYLKAYLVATDGEGMDFGGFVCPYNILNRIHKRLKGEETLAEIVNQKKDMESINMYKYEAIKVYTFSIVSTGLFGGKRSTKSYIGPLPDYIKWRNKSF